MGYFAGIVIGIIELIVGGLFIGFGAGCYTHQSSCITNEEVDFGLIGSGVVLVVLAVFLLVFTGIGAFDYDDCSAVTGTIVFISGFVVGILLVIIGYVLRMGRLEKSALLGAGFTAIPVAGVAALLFGLSSCN